MTLARLVRRNVARHPVRASLTFAFAALAVFLVVFLRSVVVTFDRFVETARPDRLMVQSAVATFGEMPAAEKHGWVPGQPTALSHRARAFQKFARARLGSP